MRRDTVDLVKEHAVSELGAAGRDLYNMARLARDACLHNGHFSLKQAVTAGIVLAGGTVFAAGLPGGIYSPVQTDSQTGPDTGSNGPTLDISNSVLPQTSPAMVQPGLEGKVGPGVDAFARFKGRIEGNLPDSIFIYQNLPTDTAFPISSPDYSKTADVSTGIPADIIFGSNNLLRVRLPTVRPTSGEDNYVPTVSCRNNPGEVIKNIGAYYVESAIPGFGPVFVELVQRNGAVAMPTLFDTVGVEDHSNPNLAGVYHLRLCSRDTMNQFRLLFFRQNAPGGNNAYVSYLPSDSSFIDSDSTFLDFISLRKNGNDPVGGKSPIISDSIFLSAEGGLQVLPKDISVDSAKYVGNQNAIRAFLRNARPFNTIDSCILTATDNSGTPIRRSLSNSFDPFEEYTFVFSGLPTLLPGTWARIVSMTDNDHNPFNDTDSVFIDSSGIVEPDTGWIKRLDLPLVEGKTNKHGVLVAGSDGGLWFITGASKSTADRVGHSPNLESSVVIGSNNLIADPSGKYFKKGDAVEMDGTLYVARGNKSAGLVARPVSGGQDRLIPLPAQIIGKKAAIGKVVVDGQNQLAVMGTEISGMDYLGLYNPSTDQFKTYHLNLERDRINKGFDLCFTGRNNEVVILDGKDRRLLFYEVQGENLVRTSAVPIPEGVWGTKRGGDRSQIIYDSQTDRFYVQFAGVKRTYGGHVKSFDRATNQWNDVSPQGLFYPRGKAYSGSSLDLVVEPDGDRFLVATPGYSNEVFSYDLAQSVNNQQPENSYGGVQSLIVRGSSPELQSFRRLPGSILYTPDGRSFDEARSLAPGTYFGVRPASKPTERVQVTKFTVVDHQ